MAEAIDSGLLLARLSESDRSVPPDDEVTSLTVVGGTLAGMPGGSLLPRTGAWCLEAQGESPAAQEALEKLCRTYWRPIYGFRSDDRELGRRTQKILPRVFLRLLLERKDLNTVRKEKGRLRSYLLTSVKTFYGRRVAPCDGYQAR